MTWLGRVAQWLRHDPLTDQSKDYNTGEVYYGVPASVSDYQHGVDNRRKTATPIKVGKVSGAQGLVPKYEQTSKQTEQKPSRRNPYQEDGSLAEVLQKERKAAGNDRRRRWSRRRREQNTIDVTPKGRR